MSEHLYFKLIDKKQTQSPLRELAGPSLHRIAQEIHERFPYLSADHLSLIKAGIGVTGSLAAIKEQKGIAAALLSANILLDGVDGTLARLIAEENQIEPSDRGTQIDTLTDFNVNLSMNVARIVAAHRRKDRRGERLAYAATITDRFARYFYWRARGQGYDLPEMGRNPLDMLGTHVAKPFCFMTATVEDRLQTSLDAATTLGNVTSMVMNTALLPEEKTLGDNARRIGEVRGRLHILTSAVTLAVAGTTYLTLQRRERSKE